MTYRTSLESAPTLKHTVLRLGRREKVVREIEALKNVSFEVPEGQVLGVVGANGAGKSTLMRTVAGILPPNSGRVEVHGRVSTLLALGVGFNRKMTGRQNVVLGGLAAGLTRAQLAGEVRRDRRLRRARGLHGHADADVLLGHVRAARVRRRGRRWSPTSC